MNEPIWYDDLEQFLLCPRRFQLDKGTIERSEAPLDSSELLRFGFSVERPILEAEIFGVRFIADPDLAVLEENGWRLVLKKEAKRFKQKYAVEAAYHAYIFSQRGFPVNRVTISSPYFEVDLDWRDALPRLISLLENITTFREELYDPRPTSLCKTCPHVIECSEALIRKKDLLAIHGLNERTRAKLLREGIEDLEDLLNTQKLKDFSKDVLEKLKKKATALLERRPILLESIPALPEGLFLDIESHVVAGYDYLFGILSGDEYIPFLCEDKEHEGAVFKRVIDFLLSKDGPIYHYCAYEPTHFRELARLHGVESDYIRLRKRFVDVYQILSRHVALPLFSYSLKSVARYYGFSWRTKLDGWRACKYFQMWLSTKDPSLLDTVMKYNEDDVRATQLLVEKLRSMGFNETLRMSNVTAKESR
jgi:predicted RecB family nuclease